MNMEFIYSDEGDKQPVCESGIFCHGDLLYAVQMSGIFPDSKTFVDKKLKRAPLIVIKSFNELLKRHGDPAQIPQKEIEQFLEENFDPEGLEFNTVLPFDWTSTPKFMEKLENKKLRGLARRINTLWKQLSRRIIDDVKLNPSLYSIIYVPNIFVVPGGRFREFYYWDTYWVIKALLHCEMFETVRGMIENFFVIIEQFGLVPNGGRIYYKKRSQPPLLCLMVKDYFDRTGNVEFMKKNIGFLVKEMSFWEENRSVIMKYGGDTYTLYRYGTGGTGPRPESFREDFELAESFKNEEKKDNIYYNLKAGAETGWDYSSRWFISEEGEGSNDMKDIRTNAILPVDLNCIIYKNYTVIADIYAAIGDYESAKTFRAKAGKLKTAIQIVLYDEEEKVWFDYDMLNKKLRKYFYLSNLFPLWVECFPEGLSSEDIGKSAVAYLKKEGAFAFTGGVPTSLRDSGQQWDFPNAWPPLQHILVVGLLNCGQQSVAQSLARMYTEGAMFSCADDAEACQVYEKYDVTKVGGAGGGGEYDVQEGFGWTNGVVIDFLAIFGDDLLVETANEVEAEPKLHEVVTAFDISSGKSTIAKKAKDKIKLLTKFNFFNKKE